MPKKKVILNETFCNLVNIRLLKLKECYLKSVGGDSIFNEIVFFFDFYMALFNGTHLPSMELTNVDPLCLKIHSEF